MPPSTWNVCISASTANSLFLYFIKMEVFLKKPGCAQEEITRPIAQSFKLKCVSWKNVNLMNANKLRHFFYFCLECKIVLLQCITLCFYFMNHLQVVRALWEQNACQSVRYPQNIWKPSGIKCVQGRGKQRGKMRRHYSKQVTN